MSKRPLFLSVVAAVFGVILLAVSARRAEAVIPGADDPKAYTTHDYLRGRVDFNKRTLVGAYQAVGKRDPKWDAAAIKFLDAMTIYFAYGPAEPIYRTVERAPHEQLLAMIKAAADAGCDDPMVDYCHGVVLQDAGQVDEAKPLIEKAAAGLAERKYPPFRIAAANARLTGYAERAKDAAAAKHLAAMTWMNGVGTVRSKHDDRDIRYVLEAIDHTVINATAEQLLALCKAAEASPDANQWLVNLLYGRYEVKAAWQARGGGWANTVTDDGWKSFFDHLSKARDYLTKAQQLRPDLPEAATEMIAVAMGGGSRLNEKERDWFDRAVKAQLDYYPAYHSYVWSIYPRWGGSHQEMFKFGLECLQTQRFDTYVPYRLMVIVENIDTDSSNDFAILKDPQVQTAVRQLLTQSYEKVTDPQQKAFYASYQAAIAWKLGNYRESADLLDKVGEQLETEPFYKMGAWPPGAVSQVRVMTTRHAKALQEAERNAQEGEYNPALLAYLDVSSQLPQDHPGQIYLKHRAKVLEIEKDFAAGKWASLKPDANFDPWELFTGDWKVEKDGSLRGTSDAEGKALLLCRANLGEAYELEGKIDFPDPEKRAVVALFMQWTGPRQYRAAGLNATNAVSTVFVTGAPRGAGDIVRKLKGGERVGVRVHEGKYDVLVDGEAVFTGRELNANAAQNGFVGIGIYVGTPGRVVQFKDVQVRRFDPANK
ncbi:MAG: hypothetical protein JWN40_744 [Phycisphaerales bacterium]|nr:hypothetical protein [Phycisphaerales bacterium]